MSLFFYTSILAIILGGVWVVAFVWSLRAGQYDDLDGDSVRILINDDDDPMIPRESTDTPDITPEHQSQ